METFLNNTLTWLVQPQTIIAIVGFISTIPFYLKKIKEAKGKNLIDKAVEVAWPEIKKLVYSNLSNDKKREAVIRLIYSYIPERERKYLPVEMATILINGIYHTFIKDKITGKLTEGLEAE